MGKRNRIKKWGRNLSILRSLNRNRGRFPELFRAIHGLVNGRK